MSANRGGDMAHTVILPTLAHSSSNCWWYFLANLMNLHLPTSLPNLSCFWLTRGLILTPTLWLHSHHHWPRLYKGSSTHPLPRSDHGGRGGRCLHDPHIPMLWTCYDMCVYFKTFTLIPFLLHYYHVTFCHVTPHMTHSIHLHITWSPTSSFSHDSLFPLWVITLSWTFPHESLWLWWLYASPTISDSQWLPMSHFLLLSLTLLGTLLDMTRY